MRFAVLIEPHYREFFIESGGFGIPGAVGIIIAGIIAFVVRMMHRKQKQAGKLPWVFWLVLGSGGCLIALGYVLNLFEGPRGY